MVQCKNVSTLQVDELGEEAEGYLVVRDLSASNAHASNSGEWNTDVDQQQIKIAGLPSIRPFTRERLAFGRERERERERERDVQSS